MKRFRIEKVSDVNCTYPYLEVFLVDSNFLFLEIAISEEKELTFTLYPCKANIVLSLPEWEYFNSEATRFLQQELQDEEDFRKLFEQ